MSQVYSNSARTTLVALIDNSATTMTVTSAAAFPVLVGTDYFYATLYRGDVGAETDIEIVKVTATSSTIFTIVRGQEGTTVQNYITLGGTCRVDLRLTAAGVSGLLQAADNLSALTNLTDARSNLGLGTAATTDSTAYEPADATILKDADIGVTVQAYDADLATWAGVTPGTGVATFLATPTLANLNSAVSDTDVAAVGNTNTFSVYQVFGASIQETKTAVSASDIDCRAGSIFTKTISGTTTFTVSNVPATGTACSFTLELTNGGSATVNYWSGMKWASGTAPTLTASGVDILGFYTHDGGTTWRGMLLSKDSK